MKKAFTKSVATLAITLSSSIALADVFINSGTKHSEAQAKAAIESVTPSGRLTSSSATTPAMISEGSQIEAINIALEQINIINTPFSEIEIATSYCTPENTSCAAPEVTIVGGKIFLQTADPAVNYIVVNPKHAPDSMVRLKIVPKKNITPTDTKVSWKTMPGQAMAIEGNGRNKKKAIEELLIAIATQKTPPEYEVREADPVNDKRVQCNAVGGGQLALRLIDVAEGPYYAIQRYQWDNPIGRPVRINFDSCWSGDRDILAIAPHQREVARSVADYGTIMPGQRTGLYVVRVPKNQESDQQLLKALF